MEVEDERAWDGGGEMEGRKAAPAAAAAGDSFRRRRPTRSRPARPFAPTKPEAETGRGSLQTAQGKEGSEKTMEKGKWHARAEKNFGSLKHETSPLANELQKLRNKSGRAVMAGFDLPINLGG